MRCLRDKKGSSSRFSSKSTAEEVTQGIDGSGLTAIVTGATSGIGTETARVLALRGVHVVMAVRNMAAAENVKQCIIRQNPAAKLDAMELDLSSLDSVGNFASNYQASGLPLNILINNAGVLTSFKLSKDNIELVFATNYLAHFLLTNLLLETMKKTAEKSGREGRIVNVSSEAHRCSYRGGIRFDKINDKSGSTTFTSYAQSKLANILHANELTRRLKEDRSNITANSVHPGAIGTGLVQLNKTIEAIARKIAAPFIKTIQEGAATTCYAALHPEVEGLSGEYFVNSKLGRASSEGRDVDLGKKLWDFSVKLINQHHNF